MMAQKEMVVVVVGGSMAGLFHAIVFKHLGYEVHVLEKSPQNLLASQAAGLRAGPQVQKFIEKYVKTDKPYCKDSNLLEVINSEGLVINSFPPNEIMHLTTWSLLYRLLKSRLLDNEIGRPIATYETEKIVQDVQYDGEKLAVTYSDNSTEHSNVIQADLVIAADGAHSSVRQTVLPGQHPNYVGYVTWRGVVLEGSMSEASRKTLQDRVLIFRTNKGYALTYHVPSEDESVEDGDYQFIWVWYEMLEEDSEDFKEAFTDVNGKKHFTTIPRGKMQPKVWAKRRELGESLSPAFAELVEKTTDPFVSAIREYQSPNAVFHDGKLILAGDAFTLFRPHVAMSTNQAAMQALGLEDVFQGKDTLANWEHTSLDYAKKISTHSVVYGEYCFTGKLPATLSAESAGRRPDEETK